MHEKYRGRQVPARAAMPMLALPYIAPLHKRAIPQQRAAAPQSKPALRAMPKRELPAPIMRQRAETYWHEPRPTLRREGSGVKLEDVMAEIASMRDAMRQMNKPAPQAPAAAKPKYRMVVQRSGDDLVRSINVEPVEE